MDKALLSQIKKGIEVEMEHTDDPKMALKIAIDHIKEDPKYYDKLAKAGLEELNEGEFCPQCLAQYIREHANSLQEAEYQGRKVPLGKPMRGDVKKFKVYVKNNKGNVVKVNFGDPNMKIKKSNPKGERASEQDTIATLTQDQDGKLDTGLVGSGKYNMLNYNIEGFKCLVKQSYFTKNPKDSNIFHNCYAFGVQSVDAKILTFHVMTDYGMLRSRVPLSEIYMTPPKKDIPYYFKQLWDCFGPDAAIIKDDFLKDKRCQVILRDKTKVWATYLMTIDWQNNTYSNEPSDYKCGHILVADDGYLLCMPNNRIYWKDSNWITKNFPVDSKMIKVDTELLNVESVSDRWVSEDSDSFYYDINQSEN